MYMLIIILIAAMAKMLKHLSTALTVVETAELSVRNCSEPLLEFAKEYVRTFAS